jgi:AAT family amino acid transporter
VSKEPNLQQNLKSRHLQMIAIGGMIGAGFFQGSAEVIELAGPGVIMTYLLGGLLLLVVMSALAEMATVFPKQDIRRIISLALGARVSFVIGGLYWMSWVLVMALEVVTAGKFLQFWFPQVPLWGLSLCVAFLLSLLNLSPVKYFGETEFWISGIKVLTLIMFIVFGGYLLLKHPDPTQNLIHQGGFFPHGMSSVFSALLVVLFSYGGAELIGMTLAETENAQRVLPRVVRSTVTRILLFYTVPILIICGLTPWNQLSSHASPFLQVFIGLGFTGAAHFMNFVMLTAVISAANSGLYATSRLLFSLAREGQAPSIFKRLNHKGVPTVSVWLSLVGLLLGSVISYVSPENVFHYLMGIPGFVVLSMWILICLAQLKLRSTYKNKLSFRVIWFPHLTRVTLLILFGILIKMLFDPEQLISSVLFITMSGILLIVYSFKDKENRQINKDRAA